jgi:CRP-like cAMP-binding protein
MDALPVVKRASKGNKLLDALPRREREHLVDGCEEVNLAMSEVLFEPGDHVRHVQFPTTGFITLLTPTKGSMHLEVGLVGFEGMAGTPLVLGIATSPLQALVQGGGCSLRMDAAPFLRELGRSPSLKMTLDRYLFVRMTQLAQSAGCTRYHLVEARLARWLLMTQDRARSTAFRVTHETLALMLGVRRVGVTRAASSLQKQGLIRYRRGDVVVLNRAGLTAASCSCYLTDRAIYSEVFG